MLHDGQMRLGSPMRALLCVGVAYFLIGVLVPLAVLYSQGEGLKGFNTSGTTMATVAGALGAIGAACIIFSFRTGGTPHYVMPLVFGGAPLVNVLYTMYMHPPRTAVNPLLYVGFLVTAVGAGTASISATVDGVSGSTSVTVTRPPVVTVAVTPATITVGQKLRLTATVTDTRGNVVTDRVVTWSVPSNLIASVDPSTGEVTGLLPGSVTVTATSEGKSGSALVTVGLVPVATVTIAPSSRSIDQNEATTLAATTKDALGGALSGRTVTWQTSDASIASLSATSGSSVDITGGVTGTATITATSEGKSGTATVTVRAGKVSKVRLTLSPSSVREGQQSTATAVVLDGRDRPLQGVTVSWSSKGGAATISPETSITSTGANSTATATATAKDVIIFTSKVEITASVGGERDTKQLTVQP